MHLLVMIDPLDFLYQDAMALLRLDDIYIESFLVDDGESSFVFMLRIMLVMTCVWGVLCGSQNAARRSFVACNRSHCGKGW